MKPLTRVSRTSFCIIGVRPNSPPHTTSVSSSRPRALRSVIRPATRAVDLLAFDRQGLVDRLPGRGAVVVPAPVVELDEAHPGLDEAAREQAIIGEGWVVAACSARAGRPWRRWARRGRGGRRRARGCACRLTGDVHHRRHAASACGRRARTGPRASGSRDRRPASCSMRLSACTVSSMPRRSVAAHARRVAQVEHRIADRAALDALVDAGQEAAAPHRLAGIGGLAAGAQHDEAGEVAVDAPQAVVHPRCRGWGSRSAAGRCGAGAAPGRG
jgi:hypothetical protein